ncbi:hypothetical protein Tco_1207984 [Tanacetum coccineum]
MIGARSGVEFLGPERLLLHWVCETACAEPAFAPWRLGSVGNGIAGASMFVATDAALLAMVGAVRDTLIFTLLDTKCDV